MCWLSAYTILRIITVIICVTCFFYTSYVTLDAYINAKTVVSNDIAVSESLMSPNILLCNATSFKRRILNTEIYEYQNNSLMMQDFLSEAVFIKTTRENSRDIYNATTIKDKISAVPTAFHGNCFLIAPSTLVSQLCVIDQVIFKCKFYC